ncbi:MAG TPA: 1-(5-phosphoribosyl)-5-[(5-phosphoribosylamino)methylideneamino]imidazole-4-carboxamide isomerase [Anaerolineales bacterium]|nr:1-(5-phosphoribosyl)-5-[(5-phosphoribosylamino)methylideneamino]imidazole-4-carboxamide isomerase [Anaerolineales bacterium]
MRFTVYPAIDLRAGKVVRLQEGDPERMTAYSDDPAQTARRWLEAGALWLHVVNLDGAFGENQSLNRAALRMILKTTAAVSAKVQFGGGIRSLDAVKEALDLGIRRVILGTVAAEQPEIIGEAIQTFGSEQIAVGLDARDGLVRVRGWKEDSGIPAADLALQLKDLGLRTIIFTDIRRDGLGSGLNIDATRALAKATGLDVIASGGVHTIEDVIAAREAGLAGTVVGRALYEGTIDLGKALKV